MPRFPADMGCARFCVFALAMTVVGARASSSSTSLTSSNDTLDLPPTATHGARPVTPESGVHRIEGAALRRFATLEDALASLPGFHVRRAGGLGGYSELSFRGARASAVEVFVDGVRLNQDGDGPPDLSKWPSLWFTSLEARTGFDAAGSSSGTLARIDLSTRSDHSAEAHARAGSFGTIEAAAQVQTEFGRGRPAEPGWRWTFGVEGQSARNDYPVNSDNGTVYNPDDDVVWNMDNNAYRSRGARAAARHGDGSRSQSFSLLWLDSRKEYPGLFASSSHAYTLRTDWLAAWRMTRSFLERDEQGGAAAVFEAGVQARRFEDSYHDPGQTLGTFSFEQARVSHAVEADAAVGLPLLVRGFGDWSVRSDVRLRAENVDPTVTPNTQHMTSPAAQRYEAGGGLRATVLLPAALIVVAEVRPALIRFNADGVRPFPSGPLSAPVSEVFTPVAMRLAFEANTRMGVWSALLRREPRPPSTAEYLGDNNGIQHNPELQAEENRSASLSYRIASANGPRTASLQTTVYANTYNSPIRLAARGASPFLRYENGADYRAFGAEWSAYASTGLFEGMLSLSAQDAEILEGLDAGNRPAHLSEVEAHAETYLKPVTGSRLGPVLDFRGPYYPGEANIPDSRRAAEWDLGAHVDYEHGRVRFALDGRNILDHRTRDFAYSPRSGRSWSALISLSL